VNNARALRVEPTSWDAEPDRRSRRERDHGAAGGAANRRRRAAGEAEPGDGRLRRGRRGARNVAATRTPRRGMRTSRRLAAGRGQGQGQCRRSGERNSAAATIRRWPAVGTTRRRIFASIRGGQGNTAGGAGAAVCRRQQNIGGGLLSAVGGVPDRATEMYGVVAGARRTSEGQARPIGAARNLRPGTGYYRGGVSNKASSTRRWWRRAGSTRRKGEYAAIGAACLQRGERVGARARRLVQPGGGDKSLAAAIRRGAGAGDRAAGRARDEDVRLGDAQGGPFTSTWPNQFLVAGAEPARDQPEQPASALDLNGR